MKEYVTEAIVLSATPVRDADKRFSLFTKELGKVRARAASVRKISSRLAGHLEPGTMARVRLVEKNEMRITDALKISRLKSIPSDFYVLDRLLAEGEPDSALWTALSSGDFSWGVVLRILGWDSKRATCSACSRAKPEIFNLVTQNYYCVPCIGVPASGNNDIIFLQYSM